MIMAACEDGAAKGVVRGDIDTAFVCENTCVNLPVSESGLEGKRDVFVHRLESLEDEGVTRGRGFNAMREGSVNQVDKKGRWEESDVGVVRVIHGEEVRSAGKGVRASKKLSGHVDHLEVKVSKVNKPTCLAAVKHLRLTKIGKILMIGEDLHRERGAVEVVAPGFQGANDSKEFAIIYVVVAFSGRE